MSRESHYTAIILKKQPFGEADEIITFFTKEQGKVRALAKSVKLSKSRLQSRLQALFLVSITLAGGNLKKIISAETVKVYESIRQNLGAVKNAFYACELVLKFTPDEQINQPLFLLLEDFFTVLDSGVQDGILNAALAKFKIGVLECVGLSVSSELPKDYSEQMFFSPATGGFTQKISAGGMPVSPGTNKTFLELKQTSWMGIKNVTGLANLDELNKALSQFIEYQLERTVKSEKYLNQNMV